VAPSEARQAEPASLACPLVAARSLETPVPVRLEHQPRSEQACPLVQGMSELLALWVSAAARPLLRLVERQERREPMLVTVRLALARSPEMAERPTNLAAQATTRETWAPAK